MKFSLLGAGKAAEHPVEFPVIDGEGNTVTAKCLAVPLSGTEYARALHFATEYCKKNGMPDASEGHSLWDVAYMAKACHLACLDPDSPPKARTPYFASPEEILALPQPTLAYIFELQQHWQDECSPMQKRLPANELLEKVRELAEAEDERPFLRLSPALRWICMRYTASLLMKLLVGNSLDSSFFENSGPTSSATPKSEQKPSESESAERELTTTS